MRCYECGGEYTSKSGTLQITDKYIGAFTVDLLEYMRCESCGDFLFSPDASQFIDSARKVALESVLQSQPISAFMSATEVTGFLGISRQALHKHRRIRRGFIFHTRFGGNIVYLKKSVELFAKTGDGRFVLCQYMASVQYTKKMETAIPDLWYSLMPPVYSVPIPFGPSKRTSSPRRYNYV